MKIVQAKGQNFTPPQIMGSAPDLKSLVDSGKYSADRVRLAWTRAKRIAKSKAEADSCVKVTDAYVRTIFDKILDTTLAASATPVRAAQRLSAASADESKARKLIKTLTGETVTKMRLNDPGRAIFQLEDSKSFMRALDALTKRFGRPTRPQNMMNSHQGGVWKLDDTKSISMNDGSTRGGIDPNRFKITLVDTNHTESTMQTRDRAREEYRNNNPLSTIRPMKSRRRR